jgi:hypothetical protein
MQRLIGEKSEKYLVEMEEINFERGRFIGVRHKGRDKYFTVLIEDEWHLCYFGGKIALKSLTFKGRENLKDLIDDIMTDVDEYEVFVFENGKEILKWLLTN